MFLVVAADEGTLCSCRRQDVARICYVLCTDVARVLLSGCHALFTPHAACLGAHFGSRTPYERGSRGSGDPLESFLSVSDAVPHGLVEIKKIYIV